MPLRRRKEPDGAFYRQKKKGVAKGRGAKGGPEWETENHAIAP